METAGKIKGIKNKNQIKGSVMVQGTSSNVGKSVLATALCRIFSQDKYATVPFKSWNMSLNSTVTPGGGEIGIAQAIQAEAAGVEPTVDMQPLLLKPSGKGDIQVVVRGRPLARDEVKTGEEYIGWAMNLIEESLNGLQESADIVVMEGAGSPAEMNVKDRDLANMRVALLKQTPVILVADVDRGGALASLAGTVRLLPPEERYLICGFILNKFRGDYDLLKPGLDFLEEHTGIPVLGVIPYLKDVKLPEEDSVSLGKRGQLNEGAKVKIAVISLPHISNFTDFASLESEPDVNLDYVSGSGGLVDADLIILPGTKNTIDDLLYLKKTGLAARIQSLAEQGTPVIGICGGYQMLGKRLLDPGHIETRTEEIKGLGLLPLETTFSSGKKTHQVKARITSGEAFFNGLENEIITGYEIHMGESEFLADIESPLAVFTGSGRKVNYGDGALSSDGYIFGTYLHGIFNNDKLRWQLVNFLREKKGLGSRSDYFSYQREIETGFDKLAAIVRENLDLERIYTILERDGIKNEG